MKEIEKEWDWYSDFLDEEKVPPKQRTTQEIKELFDEEQAIEARIGRDREYSWILVKLMPHRDGRVYSYWKRPKN